MNREEDIGYKIMDDGRILVAIPPDRQPEFQTILNRALNCWPSAPPEWKALADILQHGKPLQDYYSEPKPRTRQAIGQ